MVGCRDSRWLADDATGFGVAYANGTDGPPIASLTAQAETADAEDVDPQALPAEIARREALKAKLDASLCAAGGRGQGAGGGRAPHVCGQQDGL
jgi:hypothetical protein